MCRKIYEIYVAHLLSAPGLEWQAAIKKTKVKLDLLTNIDMSLMVEKRIRLGIFHPIYRYAKADKESSYLQYWDVNNVWLVNVSKASSKYFRLCRRYFSI